MGTSNKAKPFCNLDRPLAVFDIESTGVSPRSDRLIDLAIVKIWPDGRRETHTYRVNPGRPIPIETTRVHGITDEDVANSPPFRDIAQRVYDLLEGCDLGGFNIGRFDIPMLIEEFTRAGITFSIEGRRLLDAQRIFHRKEPRDLTAALAFFCGELHMDAHGAEGDVLATIRVLEGQFQRYSDLPRDMDALHEFCNPKRPEWVDNMGRLRWINGQVALNFSKKKGALLKDVMRNDPNFIKWMLRSDFPPDTRQIIQDALDGKWPEPPEAIVEDDG